MSLFRVKLNNDKQGLLDLNPSSQAQFSTSIQRTIFVAGPNRKYRQLFDGEEFTDCNYWKKFAFPEMPKESAFIEVVSDDGSIWSEIPSENNFPTVYNLSVAVGSGYDDNVADIAGDTGSYANFVQITNVGSDDIKVKINGLSGAIFTLDGGATQVFNAGDLVVTKLNFLNDMSGGTTTDVQVLCSISNKCQS